MSVRSALVLLALAGCDIVGSDDAGLSTGGDDAAAECPCDGSISKRAASSFTAGETGVWEVIVDWQGAEYCSTEALCVVDTLPGGQSLLQSSDGWDCSDDNGEVSCCAVDFDPTAANTSYGLKMEVSVPDDAEGFVENCATLDVTDSYAGNNESCAKAEIIPSPDYVDLAIQKSVQDPGYFTAGSTGVFVFDVTNNGTGDAGGIYITDVLPDGFSMDDQQLGDWYCFGDDAAPETVTCQYASVLAAGATESVGLVVDLESPWSYEQAAENCATVDLKEDSDVNLEDNESCVSFEIDLPSEVCGNCLDDDLDGEVDEDCEYSVDVMFSADDRVTMYVDGTAITTTTGYSTADSFTEVVVGGDTPHYIAAYVEDLGGTIAAYKAEIQVDGIQIATTGDGSFVGSKTSPGTGWQTDTTNLTQSMAIQSHNSYWNSVPASLTATGAEWIWFGGGSGSRGVNYIVREFQICPTER